ncbi:hypothetical protein TSMEX_010671 [Taenia solium]|eukprot:TsM_000932000 transcript=TsM_000932000 gene=TsM_000932000
MRLEFGLQYHPDNTRSKTIQRPQQEPRHASRTRLLDTPKAITVKSRLFGEEALEIAQRGRQDHLFFLSSHLPSASAYPVPLPKQHPHQSALQHASHTSMRKILHPNLSISPRAPRLPSPRLRGEESRDIWRRSRGTSFLLHPDPRAIADATDSPKPQCQNKENLRNDRSRTQPFFDQNAASIPVRNYLFQPRVTGEAKEILMRDRGLTNDGMSSNGVKRVQSALDVRRAKALTPYSSIDNVANILNFKPPPN